MLFNGPIQKCGGKKRRIARFLLAGLLAFVCAAAGCGYYKENRTIAKSKRVIAGEKKDIGELEQVSRELRKVIETKMRAVRYLESALRLLGAKYMEMGSYRLAEEALLEAELLKPYDAFIKKELGECYYFLAQSAVGPEEKETMLRRSLEYYQAALAIKPDLPEAVYGYGVLLAMGYGDFTGGIDQMKLLLSYNPENIDAHFALGRFYYEVGDTGRALGEYLTLTRLLPRSSPKLAKVEENILKINRETGVDGS
ncbi:MAG: tetratricopeptide repeat protein [Spirochaetes bacterium]|nr:tetratricopeptide repeat protein [Spirochaetota bacterium]